MYDEIVTAFIRDFRPSAKLEADEFRRLPSLADAIQHASLCHWLPTRKRHPHQRRIPGALLAAVERQLQACADEINGAASFDELHKIIAREIGGMRGIGELVIYDIAQRIGVFLRKEPRLVYLHAGARIGAGRLGFRGSSVDPALLPSPFSRLSPMEIEDCLCIYKDAFRDRFLHRLTPCFPESRGCLQKS